MAQQSVRYDVRSSLARAAPAVKSPRDETDEMGREDASACNDMTVRVLEVQRARQQKDRRAMLLALRQLADQCRYNSHELSRALRISQRQLQRIFARDLGCAPRKWLSEQRLLAAHELLHRGCSVKEATFALGFRTVSQFSRDFKARFGVAPKAMMDACTERPGLRYTRDTAVPTAAARRVQRA